jgi:hypothetical protein
VGNPAIPPVVGVGVGVGVAHPAIHPTYVGAGYQPALWNRQ